MTVALDLSLKARLAASAAAAGAWVSTGEFLEWFERAQAVPFRVDRIAFDELDDWSFEPGTGNLVHRSGRFFTVEGLRIDIGMRTGVQPVIVQSEVSMLGLLAKEFDGVLHVLVQAKVEPGNGLQLAPTVQATPSNYHGVHNGAAVRYLDYFTGGRRVRVLADVQQSGHGSWYFHKSSRNVIVEALDDVPVEAGFCWLTIGQLGELMRRDWLVNTDTRTVLGCAPVLGQERDALHSSTDLLAWFFAERARLTLRARRVPLADATDWVRGRYSVDHVRGQHFRIMAVAVRAGNREVPHWTQPLLEPVRPATAAFVLRRFHGVPHVLVQARAEGGVVDTVELGPTVQYTPDHYGARPAFGDLVAGAPPHRVRYRATLAEEGGRFFRAETTYLVVEADPADAPDEPPPGFRWVTPGQLTTLVHHGRYVNVQARTLLAAFNSGAVR